MPPQPGICKKACPVRADFFTFNHCLLKRLSLLCGCRLCQRLLPEQEGHAPQCGDRHKNINGTADERRRTAEKPCHQVEFEHADQTPVDTADDKQNQCEFIPHYKIHLFPAAPCKNTCPLFTAAQG